MKAEIIAVGTEILLGEVLNSNAKFLAESLKELGIDSFYQTVVGDNVERFKDVLAIALGRSDILIYTGGIGPTPDDLTHEAIGSFFGLPLDEFEKVKAALVSMFESRGRKVSVSNFKQAMLPRTSQLLPNPIGTAWGIWLEPMPQKFIVTMPGVPTEMKRMWKSEVEPLLRERGLTKAGLNFRDVRVFGIPESKVAEMLAEHMMGSEPSVATYVEENGVRIRIACRGDVPESIQRLDRFTRDVLAPCFQDHIYSTDGKSLSDVIAQILTQNKESLSVAESCSGGLLSKLLTDVPGSSKWFSGGIISYTNPVKEEFLSVKVESLKKYGAVSKEVAYEMASGVKRALKTTWGVSITGYAGPTPPGNEQQVGLIFIGIEGPEGLRHLSMHQFGNWQSRAAIRHQASNMALNTLRLLMIQSPNLTPSLTY
jgi:nicotinamide-nucleotide amidase